MFGDDFYIEIQNNGLDLQDQCTPVAARHRQASSACRSWPPPTPTTCARTTPTPTTCCSASTPARSTTRGKRKYPEERLPNPFYVRSPEDMYQLFPDYADAVARSQEIADGVDIQLDFKKRHFPVFTPPEGKTPEEYLRELCETGLTERYGDNPSRGRGRPAGARAGHHLPDGVRQLLPHRLGLRPLRPRERHPVHGPRLRRAGRSSATC